MVSFEPYSTASPAFEVINAPHRAPILNTSIFLAGSIADNYHDSLISALSHLPLIILNPLRPDWNTLLPEDITNPPFREQVEWELDMQQQADLVVVFFAKNTQAPISLLELGLAAGRGRERVIVCVQRGYWKEGNLRVVCERFRIEVVDSLDELAREVLI